MISPRPVSDAPRIKEQLLVHIPPAIEFALRCGKGMTHPLLEHLASMPRPGRRRSLAAAAGARVRDGAGVAALRTDDSRFPVERGAGFDAILAGLGISAGDALMVHSNAAAVEQLGMSLSDCIDALLAYLGPRGTLAMPTHPKLMREEGRSVYDPRRSPSTVGLMTEMFRRRRGARRSTYPLSAAAALGAQADALVAEHERSWAPHDEHSPYAKLAELGGKLLCIGVPLDRMTILHVAEDIARDSMSIPHFYQEGDIWVRDERGERCIHIHNRSGWLWWYLSKYRWARDMYRQGLAREHHAGNVLLRSADARGTVRWMQSEIRAGRTIYPYARLNRWLRLGTPSFLEGQHDG